MPASNIRYPEIISLHIPKTAGTSFRNILKSVYGDDQVVRFDINEQGIKMNEQPYALKHLPEVRVIHGHFTMPSLKENFTLPENYKLITWLRDPVKRVVSNFYYLEDRLTEILKEKRELNILNNMPRSLIDYARLEFNRNKLSKFLSGTSLSDFDFIGLTESFSEDIKRLEKILGWDRQAETLHQNKSVNSENDVPEETLEEIRSLNREDIKLYMEVMQLRNSRS